jgi:hypothetical protein
MGHLTVPRVTQAGMACAVEIQTVANFKHGLNQSNDNVTSLVQEQPHTSKAVYFWRALAEMSACRVFHERGSAFHEHVHM